MGALSPSGARDDTRGLPTVNGSTGSPPRLRFALSPTCPRAATGHHPANISSPSVIHDRAAVPRAASEDGAGSAGKEIQWISVTSGPMRRPTRRWHEHCSRPEWRVAGPILLALRGLRSVAPLLLSGFFELPSERSVLSARSDRDRLALRGRLLPSPIAWLRLASAFLLSYLLNLVSDAGLIRGAHLPAEEGALRCFVRLRSFVA